MVQLSPKDSSILTRITRYDRIPKKEREELLNQASPKAQEIGKVILGTSKGGSVDSDVMQAVDAYVKSFQPRKNSVKKAPVRRRAASKAAKSG